MYFGEMIYNLAIELNKHMDEAFKPMNIHYGQAQALLHLYEMAIDQDGELHPVRLDALNKKMYVDKSNVTRNVKKLELMGFIQTFFDDQNHKTIHFTQQGKELVQEMFLSMQIMADKMVANIAHEDQAVAYQVLDNIMQNLCGINKEETL